MRSFVSDEWTLEYDLAYSGLAEDVWIAAHLARADDRISAGTKGKSSIEKVAKRRFEKLTAQKSQKEELASKVYALFTTGKEASKAIAAQYLAERLERRVKDGELTAEALKACLPLYLVAAIEYVAPLSGGNGAAEKNKVEARE